MKFRLILIALAFPFSVLAQSTGDTAFLTARDAFRSLPCRDPRYWEIRIC